MPRLWPLNTISDSKEPGILGEVADSRSGAGNVQNEYEAFCTREQGRPPKLLGLSQKDSGVSMKA